LRDIGKSGAIFTDPIKLHLLAGVFYHRHLVTSPLKLID
jgi:hypothetical protein